MKKHPSLWISAAALALVVFSFNSCNKLDEADDFSFDAEFVVEFVIDEDGEFTNRPYQSTLTLDATDNTQVATYAAKIKEIKINKITYSINSFASDPPGSHVMLNSGQLGFGAVGAASTVVAAVPSLDLLTAGAETELDVDTDELNQIAAKLKEDLAVDVHTSCTLSQTPVQFNVPVTFYVTITANAL
jgi:hypothetical protein